MLAIPPFWCEIRRRAFAVACHNDRDIATILGRPPCFSSRFFHMPAPLEIEDWALGNPEHSARSLIGEDGWSQAPHHLCAASCIRLDYLIGAYRSELLEVASSELDGERLR